jgi:glycosyltransferase involved in cell wall biosynthesis
VIAVRNGGSMLPEALASIQAQTLPPRRIIVVDDGSTDGSADAARSAVPDAMVITQENRGVGGALDTGVAACSSSMVAFLDHDDLWLPAKGAAQMAMMLGEDRPDVVSGGVINRWVRGGKTLREEPMGSARVLGASLFRTDFVRAVGSFAQGDGYHEIVSWWTRAAGLAPRIVRDEEVVLLRRIHGANSTIGVKDEADRGRCASRRVRSSPNRDRSVEGDPS